MELNYLREFAALAQTCHYQETADRLYISQSSLSKHIKTMEAELGAELFKRTSRRVELSEFGTAFLPYAQRIAAIQEEYTGSLLRELQWKDRRMAVGISPLVTLHSLQPFLTSFSQAYPDYQIDLVERDDVALRRLLRSGSCTLVIAAQSPRFDDREFAALPYAKDILVALMTQAHPLAGRTAVTGDDLADETILQLEETDLASHLEKVRKIRTVARQSILADLVLSGMGVGILTQNAARHFEMPNLVRVPIAPEVVIRLNVLAPRNCKLPFPAKELLKFVKNLKRG